MGAAAVILNEAGRVLLVKHTYGRLNWELPGGAAEPNESIVTTALREVREETGLAVAAQRLAGVYYEHPGDFHHFVFICRRLDAAAEPRPDLVEISACAYWPPDALPRPISDFTVRRVQDAISGNVLSLPVTISPRRWLE